MSAAIVAAVVALVAGYLVGRLRPCRRASDWANLEAWHRPTGLRRAAVWVVLSAENLAWIVTHPRKARWAWQHRNDPPPPRSPAPRIDPNWPTNRRDASQEGHQQP